MYNRWRGSRPQALIIGADYGQFIYDDVHYPQHDYVLLRCLLEGMMFTLFAIAIAAAETALAIAIIVNIFRVARNIDIRDLTKMKF